MDPAPRSIQLNSPPNQNVRYRAIAPRPLLESIAIHDGVIPPSPQSSADVPLVLPPTSTMLRQKRKRQRAAKRLPRPAKRALVEPKPAHPAADHSGPLSRLRALEGTPLGKLLRGTPEIALGSKRGDTPLGSEASAHSSPPSTPRDSVARTSFPFSPLSPLMPHQTTPPNMCPPSYSLPNSPLLPPKSPPSASGLVHADVASAAPSDTDPASQEASKLEHAVPGIQRTHVTAEYLERVYGVSKEPAMVTDEIHNVLWANRAFGITAGKVLGPTGIDLQGSAIASPIPVSPLWFSPAADQEAQRAILWGFLKKGAAPDSPPAGVAAQPRRAPAVLYPQAVRSVESTVWMTRAAPLALTGVGVGAMEGSFAQVEGRYNGVDQCSTPVVLTNIGGKVRWVNEAYKLLIGQPRCTWLGGAARLMGEVKLGGVEGIPPGWVALSCTAEVRWFKGGAGEGSRVVMPAMGVRLDAAEGKETVGYVWHLNTVAVGLQLRDLSEGG